VALNWGLKKPIAFDETGFKGTGDRVYRTQAWEFLLSGGSVFSHLDYSFTADHEDGTATVQDPTPGGGGPSFRAQLSTLKRFLEGFDLARMAPDAEGVTREGDGAMYVLSEHGKQYAIYTRDGRKDSWRLGLPPGVYEYRWIDPRDGRVLGESTLSVEAGTPASLQAPASDEDIALALRRR
jgi:hypothetical protein